MLRVVASFDPGSAALALGEVRGAGGRVEQRLAPGVAVVALAAGWPRTPIFVRHVFPVDVVVAPSLDAIVEAGRDLVARADPGLRLSVQTRVLAAVGFRPREVNEPIAAASPAPVDVRHPEQVLSVVVSEGAWLGLSTVDDNLSAWAGGERRFAREPGQISRSELKLLEALEVLSVVLPPGGVALDLGAAPGGWTRLLRERGLRVIAVDPALLDPSLSDDRGVRHERVRAQEFVRRAPSVDVLVNDMRMDARDSARLTVAYAGRVSAAGIVTLKLPGERAARTLAEALRILRSGYDVTGVRQLFHNRSEVTAAIRPKEDR